MASTRSGRFRKGQTYCKLKLVDHSSLIENAKNDFSKNLLILSVHLKHRCDSTYAVAIRNLVLNLKKKNLVTIFYNLRKPIHRGLMSTMGEDEFYYCVMESQVYDLINKFAKQPELRDRSSSTSSEGDHSDEIDYVHPERNWLSQSTQEF